MHRCAMIPYNVMLGPQFTLHTVGYLYDSRVSQPTSLTNQLFDQSAHHRCTLSIKKSVRQSVRQSVSQSVSQAVSQSVRQSVIAVSQPVSQSTSQLVGHSVSQLVGKSCHQFSPSAPASQLNQSVLTGRTVGQTVS